MKRMYPANQNGYTVGLKTLSQIYIKYWYKKGTEETAKRTAGCLYIVQIICKKIEVQQDDYAEKTPRCQQTLGNCAIGPFPWQFLETPRQILYFELDMTYFSLF